MLNLVGVVCCGYCGFRVSGLGYSCKVMPIAEQVSASDPHFALQRNITPRKFLYGCLPTPPFI